MTGADGRVVIHTGLRTSELDALLTYQDLHYDSWRFDSLTGCWERIGDAPWMIWGLAYDPASDTIVGYDFFLAEDVPAAFVMNLAQPISETWVRQDGEWTSTLHPELIARNGPSMAYDQQSGAFVMFGGCIVSFGPCPAETWRFDPEARTWHQMAPTTSPVGRSYADMVYDSVLERIVLFGGVTATGGLTTVHSDVWLFDVATETWEQVEADGPPARAYPQMTYVPELERTYLFGGEGPVGDLWYLDSNTLAWTKVQAVGPSPRDRHAMGYDATAGVLVVFGGGDSLDCPFWDETWVFDLFEERWHYPDLRAEGEDPHPKEGIICEF